MPGPDGHVSRAPHVPGRAESGSRGDGDWGVLQDELFQESQLLSPAPRAPQQEAATMFSVLHFLRSFFKVRGAVGAGKGHPKLASGCWEWKRERVEEFRDPSTPQAFPAVPNFAPGRPGEWSPQQVPRPARAGSQVRCACIGGSSVAGSGQVGSWAQEAALKWTMLFPARTEHF